MPQPLEDRAARGSPANGAGAAELAELRRLLIGQELEQIAGLQNRFDDPAVRSAETAAILPGAVKAAPGKRLREALDPVFEKSFHHSVRKHPRELADAIYPVIGPAIRASITAAIREFAESLNQMIEKSASWRAVRWRMEARVTGRPFAEILLARSLLYSVEQVFLIHRESGVLLMHLAAKSAVVKDADMVSGMLTAIQDFVSDSFAQSGQELETIDVGRYKLWIQYGSKALLVGAVSGTAPVELKGVFRTALDRVHETLFAELDTFKQDDLTVFEPARPILETCFLGQKSPKNRRPWLIWTVLAMLAAVFLWLGFVEVRRYQRWNAYVESLRQQPGIAVLRADKSGPGGVIAGLKDPKAPDPAALLPTYGLDASQVRYEWQPYLSLNTPFAAERELEADVDRIRTATVRFEKASSEISLAEAARIEELAAAIGRLRRVRPRARITITGHTDEAGPPETNDKLSLDRAARVGRALAALGIPPESFSVTGVGNAQPLRAGGTEWDQAANRAVSFRVEPGGAPGR